MHIVNAMFGCGLGGIEQAFVDYCEALQRQGNRVTAVLQPQAKIRPFIEALQGVEVVTVANRGSWDMWARWRLGKVLRQLQAEAAILHGNRAVSLMRAAAKKAGTKTIGVTHNYSLAKQVGVDAFFATTGDLRRHVAGLGQAEASIYAIPNMIRLAAMHPQPHARGEVPVIAAMGRFVEKKGFAVLLDALAILRQRGVVYAARLGGEGEQAAALQAQARQLDIAGQVEFCGWVEDKSAFFGAADVFCLPSLHEPFGIILLEAFAQHIPVVTSDAEGPSEIATNGHDALIVPKGDATALADALQKLLEDAALAGALAAQAATTVKAYELDAVGTQMQAALERIVAAA